MPATARQISFTQEDLAASGGGLFATMEVPGDYEATLSDVDDYKTEKSQGWVFLYDVVTASGATVELKVWVSFSTAARWKLIEVLEAHDANLEEGLDNIDPNAFIGDVVGVTVDYPRKGGVPTSKYREIRAVYALVVQEMAIPGLASDTDVEPSTDAWDSEGGSVPPAQPDGEAPDIF